MLGDLTPVALPQVQTVAIIADAATAGEPSGPAEDGDAAPAAPESVAQPHCNALGSDPAWRETFRAPMNAVMACQAVVYSKAAA